MKRFVDQIAAYIEQENLSMDNLTIILPSERMKKYLSSAIYDRYQKPVFAPEIVTIDRWVKDHSSRAVIDKTRALVKLFDIQLKNAKEEKDKLFDEFLAWGAMLLSDFNEIDQYQLDAKQVFKNLADIKEIENWSFGEEKLSEAQLRFMEFWDRLPGYYNELNKILESKNQCYAGSAFKEVSKNIDVFFKKNKEQHFLFAGFNALSGAELSIIKQLNQLGRGHLLINADKYYYSNPRHEAGMFLREVAKEMSIKNLGFINDEISTKALNVEMVACAQNTGQVKAAASYLEKLSKEQIDETLFLLADETLVSSVLKNLPKKIGKANITLGLPIRNTSIRTWVDLLFSIQENKVRFKTDAIYHVDLQGLWNHPLVLAMLDKEEIDLIQQAEKDVVRYNRIFIKASNLNIGPKMKKILEIILEPWKEDWVKVVALIRNLNKEIYQKLEKPLAFERAIVACFDHSLIDFENIANEGLPEMSLRSFRHLFNQHWNTQNIAFHGNPLDGLQIMGLLETRGLDFKRIICIGMNEGQLPPTNPINTMIPMDLRSYLGLPTPREKQGIFAHHFYRLLHNCEELFVTYSTAEESIGITEPSRYLLQIEKELSRKNKKVIITNKIYSLKSQHQKMLKEVSKTPEIINRMDELFSKSTSASMLKKYLTCPLDFYFRYVMDFGDEDSVEEEIEQSTFGTFIHNTLEELYQPFARFTKEGDKVSPAPTNITSVDVEKMLGEYKLVIHRYFMEHFNGDKDAFMKGKNFLSYKMALELTKRFLKSEVNFLSQQTEPVFIEALERGYERDIEVEVYGQKKKVKLRGFIDRIDRIGEHQIRIIDYKSGKVIDDEVKFRSQGKLSEEETIQLSIEKKKHVLQLIQYAYLYYKEHGDVAESSIISFVSGKHKPFTLNTGKLDYKSIVTNFPKHVQNILEEVYNTDLPFEHESTGWFSYCQYCE